MRLTSETVKFFKNPHGKKIQELRERYQELDELSQVAVEIEDAEAYRSLQTEMREVFFDYLTASVVDSIYKLVPHVLIILVISLKWPVISIPFTDWQFNIIGVYFLILATVYIGKGIIKRTGLRTENKGAVSFVNVSEGTKFN